MDGVTELPAVPAIIVDTEGVYNKFCGTVVVTTISCLQENIIDRTTINRQIILFMKLNLRVDSLI
jgi:hypothetical protein